METNFAPAKRTDRRKFKNQIFAVSHSPIMNTLLKVMSGLIVVLNETRQIVAMNHAFLKAIGVQDAEEVLGMRLGESLNCKNAQEGVNGCGTTELCSTCGAVIATMTAIERDKPDEQICVLSSKKDGIQKDICLLIRSQPITIEKNRWILIFAQDITQQHFWTNMERIFFHDLSNMLATLLGYSELLSEEMPDNKSVRYIRGVSKRLHDEITLQKSLSQYKDAKYFLRKSNSSINDIKKEMILIVHGHESLEGKYLNEIWPEKNIQIYTDTFLVSKILQNMVINALEATKAGGIVKLTTRIEQRHIEWEIWNEDFIAENIQKRIFQRHFSTKSNIGRGLGTFSMKLFGEEYLKGKVYFESSLNHGTKFVLQLPR
ncbi:MAG: PAS domain-containing sensor histidine kinase [Desulfobacteraceae bacterium]|nr:PAS domain-containing sensor histidine kinase [Desulfobacteraceae bacterium]